MAMREVPVYLFTGFLDAGKTTFIQETLEDPKFNGGEKTLVLLCEEGEAELLPLSFASTNVKIIKIEDEEIITPEYLQGLEKEIGFERVVIEYNGMWLIDDLYQKLPVNWVVYQEMAFADARTFLTYNNNMRNLTVDKMDYHKIVRVINRRCQIIYEYAKDQIEVDDIEDPLPYDIEVPLVEIEDQNYAIWYTDINEEEDKYYGKTLKIKGRSLLGGGLDDDEFVIGRHIMTCCVEDIQFGGLVAKYDRAEELEHGEWVEMTAVVKKEFNHMYQSEGPVLYAVSVKQTEPPEEEVATFY